MWTPRPVWTGAEYLTSTTIRSLDDRTRSMTLYRLSYPGSKTESYVYWTVHHLDSRIKIDQRDVTCFIISLFTAQHVSNVNTSIFRSVRLTVDLYQGLYCSVRTEVLALASLFCGECLVVTCVVVVISVFL